MTHTLKHSPPTSLDAPLARLKQSREELAKTWILRLIERSSLDQIGQMPTDRVARELPDLIAEIVGAIAQEGEGGAALEAGGPIYEHASRLAGLRGGDDLNVLELSRDIASLQSLLVTGLCSEIKSAQPELLGDAVERLASVFGAIHGAAAEQLLESRSQQLEWQANTDPLTGLFNLRFMQQQLRQLIGTHKRYGHPFAILLLDIDGLKRVNDAYGHAAGDRTLVGVATALRATLREVDMAIRLGGDEFCVLAPQQTAQKATILAQRVGSEIESLDSPDEIRVGVSIGVVSCPQHGEEAEALLELADGAMYQAKAAGERVSVSPEPDLPDDVAPLRIKKNGGAAKSAPARTGPRTGPRKV